MIRTVSENVYYDLPEESPIWDDLIEVDWKGMHPDLLKQVATQLEKLGIDVIRYNSGSGDYCFRFVRASDI